MGARQNREEDRSSQVPFDFEYPEWQEAIPRMLIMVEDMIMLMIHRFQLSQRLRIFHSSRWGLPMELSPSLEAI